MEHTQRTTGLDDSATRRSMDSESGTQFSAPMGGSSRGTGTLRDEAATTPAAASNDTNPREQIETKLNDAMGRAATGLDSAARRLDEMAERRTQGSTGTTARAGEYAHTAAEGMHGVANYLRENDVRGLQSDLEKQVRERPLQSLLVAVAAGWLVGKILR